VQDGVGLGLIVVQRIYYAMVFGAESDRVNMLCEVWVVGDVDLGVAP
jgi:hypothetical protein